MKYFIFVQLIGILIFKPSLAQAEMKGFTIWSPKWTFSCDDLEEDQKVYTEKRVRESVSEGLKTLADLNPDFFNALLETTKNRKVVFKCEDVPLWVRLFSPGAVAAYIPLSGNLYLGGALYSPYSAQEGSGAVLHEFLHFLVPGSHHHSSEFNKVTKENFLGIERDVAYACSSAIYPLVYMVGPQLTYINMGDWNASLERSCESCLRFRLDSQQKFYISDDPSVVSAAKSKCSGRRDLYHIIK